MSVLMSLYLLQAAATTTPATTQVATTPPDDAKIVCRTLQATGSRLAGKRVCLSKKEWRRMHDESRATAEEYQNHQSKQPGNQ
jgi:hypothetical protein